MRLPNRLLVPIALCAGAAALIYPLFSYGGQGEIRRVSAILGTGAAVVPPGDSLRVLTFNIAHGRGNAFNQLFLSRKTIERNLTSIGQVLASTDADVVALQEADGASRWSGSFDHLQRVAAEGDYGWSVHAPHASNWLFKFGTAVLSRLPITGSFSHNFAPSPPTPRKGFVLGEVAWPRMDTPDTPVTLDIVSVHLDFLNAASRASQVEEMVSALSGRANPMIVLGDFNSEWAEENSPVRALAAQLNLKAYRTEAGHLVTHEDTRIDWILLSPQLIFKSYTVLPQRVSDHQAVLAEVGFEKGPPEASPGSPLPDSRS